MDVIHAEKKHKCMFKTMSIATTCLKSCACIGNVYLQVCISYKYNSDDVSVKHMALPENKVYLGYLLVEHINTGWFSSSLTWKSSRKHRTILQGYSSSELGTYSHDTIYAETRVRSSSLVIRGKLTEPLVNEHNNGKSRCLLGMLTISTGPILNGTVLVITRG